MTQPILTGIGMGLAGLLGTIVILWFRKYQTEKAKARAFDVEIAEKQVKANIDSLDPDALIAEANKFMGKKD